MKVYTGDVIMTKEMKRELDFVPVGSVKKRKTMSYLEYKCEQYRMMIYGASTVFFILGFCIGLFI